jgi:prepilin-type N-terminal cleavage/methylation domain-containing protein
MTLFPRPHGGARPTARAGFTLMELMMVVVVIGLISGTVALSWESILPRTRLNSEVRGIAGMLQSTRSDAIARNAEFYVEYDLTEDTYQVLTAFRKEGGLMSLRDEEDERLGLGARKLADGVQLASIYLNGEEYTDGKVRVRFDPLGAASDHALVVIQPAYEATYTIEVLALTGLIRFHEGVFTREPPQDGDFD